MYQCPICLKEYEQSRFSCCECGFQDYNAYDEQEETLFKIFKYTKNVFLNRIDYAPSLLDIIYEDEGKVYVDIISKSRGLEIIESQIPNSVAINGVLAFYKDTKALIINCDYAHREFLDESNVKILFVGKNFKGFIGEPLHLDRIKYLYVDKDNPYFKAENNILVKK